MTTLFKKAATSMALAALLVTPAFAQANVGVTSTTDTNAYLDASLGADDTVNASTSADVGVDATVEAESESETESTGSSTYQRNAGGVTVLSSSEVESETDLVIFGKNIAEKEEAISDVEFDISESNESEVIVAYEQSGKLLGFIPVTVTSRVIVKKNDEGVVEVKTDHPWYRFLVVADPSLRAEIENRVKENDTVRAYAGANASVESHARIAEAVIADVKTELSATATVSN